MSESEVKKVAENSNFIVNGYAFTEREDGFVSILNLECPDCAMVVFIKENYKDMYKMWKTFGGKDLFHG